MVFGQKQLTEVIGELLILDITLFRFICLEKQFEEAVT